MSQHLQPTAPIGKIRSPWGVWWLSLITFGIYYLVWYVKLNKELARAAGADVVVGAAGMWIGQCIPIANWVGLAHTVERMQIASQRHGAASTVSGGIAILSSLWFSSQTRYLQRRANNLWRYMEMHNASHLGLAQHRAAEPARLDAQMTRTETEPIA